MGDKSLRHVNYSFFLVPVSFKNRKQDPGYSDSSSVDRMDKFLLIGLVKIVNVQPSTLVRGTIRSTAYLAKSFLGRHPGFNIVLAVSSCSELFCCHVKNSVLKTQFLDNFFLNLDEILE